jgi:hypothetical protein
MPRAERRLPVGAHSNSAACRSGQNLYKTCICTSRQASAIFAGVAHLNARSSRFARTQSEVSDGFLCWFLYALFFDSAAARSREEPSPQFATRLI